MEKLYGEKEEGFRCALTGGCWQGEAVEHLLHSVLCCALNTDVKYSPCQPGAHSLVEEDKKLTIEMEFDKHYG